MGSKPVSEPLGRRQHDANGEPITSGWTHDRSSTAMKRIDTTDVEQFSTGDQARGKRA